jgi:monolysocardiolipin acyltransferase
MPEPRIYSKFIPRLWKDISITFGDPVRVTSEMQDIITKWREDWSPHEAQSQSDKVRIKLVQVLQAELYRMGEQVKSGSPAEH